MSIQTLTNIAKKYREKEAAQGREFIAEYGFIRVSCQGEPYGWAAEMGEAGTECPGSFLISCKNEVWVAVGGNDYDGGKEWVKVGSL